MSPNPPLLGPPLRLAVLANFDSPHAWRWVKVFVERGHDVHAISFYRPAAELPGVKLHILQPSPGAAGAAGAAGRGLAARLPPSLLRLVNAARFQRAGLKALLRDIAPDVFHAHFVVEHGFFGALAGFQPYVVSAWGSDLFQAPRTPAGAFLARYALKRARLVTANDPALGREAARLSPPGARVEVVRLGLEREFLEAPLTSVNLRSSDGPPTVFSDRALEPLYNVDVVIRAFAKVRERIPVARLVIAHDGSERAHLERLCERLGLTYGSGRGSGADPPGGEITFRANAPVEFVGRWGPQVIRSLLNEAHVYVSVPSSDSLSLSTMEAMAAGPFPVVTDLPSQDWITHRVNGLRVPARDVDALAESLHLALTDAGLRREAAALNRARVEADGDLEKNMLVMERHYYGLRGSRT